jgi:hypothetical protein
VNTIWKKRSVAEMAKLKALADPEEIKRQRQAE